MKRRYVLTGLGLVLAIAVAVPVIAQTAEKSAVSSQTKKAVKKEVAKQLKNKTGPAGPAGATGAQGPRGPSESFVRTADPGGFLGTTFSSVVHITGGEAPGTHAFTAVVDVFDQVNGTSNGGNVDCQLRFEGPVGDTTLDSATLNVGEADAGHIAEGQLTLVGNAGIVGGLLGSRADVECRGTTAGANVDATGTLRAIQVEDSTDLP